MPSSAFFKGKFMPLSEARMPAMTNALHYGVGVFEGIRGNWNNQEQQLYLFRLKEHYERLYHGCQVLKMELPHTIDELCQITAELAQRCGFHEDVYIRPLAYKSSESLGVRLHDLECDFLAFAFPWGPYLDLDKARCCVSSWRFPREVPRAKLTGLYITNALAKTEAVENGFDEGIMLTPDGYIAEGSGENIFLIKEGKIITPASYDGILLGITRDTVIGLARNELNIDTTERHVDRTELYTADECFLTGTAANITPVSEIDGRKVGTGEVGEITKKLQELYMDVIRGRNAKYLEWCTSIYKK